MNLKRYLVWSLSGLLVGIGVVGLLTGLPLAVIGLIFAIRERGRGRGGAWLFIVGLGLGAVLLTAGDVMRFENDECIGAPGRGFECVASGAHEIFWGGVILAVTGFIIGAITRLMPKNANSQPSDPSPLESQG